MLIVVRKMQKTLMLAINILFSSVKSIREDECELNCLARGHMFFLRLLPKVKDGTPCLTDLKKVCIDGKCKVCTL